MSALGFPYQGQISRRPSCLTITGALTVVKLPTFGEEIEVYVKEDQLKTDHRVYLSGLNFLTLHY